MSQLIVARGESPAAMHNYLNDGSAENLAQIDVAQAFPSNLTFYVNNGNETIAQVAPGNGSAHAVEVVTGGASTSDGLFIGDATNAPLPAGAYVLGFDVKTPDGPVTLRVRTVVQDGFAFSQFDFNATDEWQRVIVGIVTDVDGAIKALVRGSVVPAVSTRIWVDNAMLTEGNPGVFADGASAGWSWSGAAHASASHGPQP